MVGAMSKSYFQVLLVELSTGIILDRQQEYQQGNDDDSRYYFETWQEAFAFSREMTAKTPEIECLILNEDNEFVHVERNQRGYSEGKES